MKLIVTLLSLLSTQLIFASASEGHDVSATDLIAPAVNVLILAGFLVWKLKGPLKSHFTQKSTDVENQMNSAKIKAEEAEALIKREENNMKNLDSTIVEMKEMTQKEISDFEQSYQTETKAKIEKLSLDAEARIEAEKTAELNSLSEELINEVVLKAKDLVKNDPSKSKQVTDKLLQSLGQ